MKKKLLTLLAVVTLLVGCSTSNKQEENAMEQNKKLIVYYSQFGTTHKVAQIFADVLNADTLRLDVTNPYSGTYDETIVRCQEEMQNGVLPTLNPIDVDFAQYDTIFVGSPVWFGSYAPPIAALFQAQKFEGKTIVPFFTFGSGIGESAINMREALPNANLTKYYGVRSVRLDKAEAEIERFLIENGLMCGEIEPLPEFPAQTPITEEETAIFDAACGDYQFPLGTPISAAKRSITDGVEYRFEVKSKDFSGNDTQTVIFVIDSPDAQPIFTEVIR